MRYQRICAYIGCKVIGSPVEPGTGPGGIDVKIGGMNEEEKPSGINKKIDGIYGEGEIGGIDEEEEISGMNEKKEPGG